MHIKHTSYLFTGLVLLLTTISISSTFFAFHILEKRRRVSQEYLFALEAIDQLHAGSDSLTSAIRAYAATGNEQFREAFRKELSENRSRDLALERLQRLNLTAQERQLLIRAKKNSDSLILFEDQAAAEAAAGNFQKAKALVYGTDYTRAKTSILEPITRARTSITSRFNSLCAEYTRTATLTERIAILSGILNGLSIVFVLLVFFQQRIIKPLGTLQAKARRLVTGADEISFRMTTAPAEIRELAQSLDDYRAAQVKLDQQNWAQHMLTDMNAIIRSGKTPETIAQKLLLAFCVEFSACCAAMFLKKTAREPLSCIGACNFDGKQLVPLALPADTGLSGPLPDSHQLTIVDKPSTSFPALKAALLPTTFWHLTIPLKNGPRIIAYIELVSPAPPNERHHHLLETLSTALSPGIEVLLRSMLLKNLLKSARLQAKDLAEKTQNLQEITDEQQAIFDAATMGIVMLRNRIIVRCNRKLEELFGYDHGEMIGMETRAWYPCEQDYLDVGRDVAEMVSTTGSFRIECILTRKDGSRFWARMSGQSFATTHDSSALVDIIEDISYERLSADSLEKAREAAEAANRAKTAFLANMSHEIRTPLNAILGIAQIATKSCTTNQQRSYFRKISDSGQHLLKIVTDLLDFSKIESGKLAIEHADFDLEELVAKVSEIINEKAVTKGLELICDIAPDVPRILIGDALRISQILLNFGTNAVKFTNQGELCITIQVLEHHASDVLLRFAVKDTGIGLSQEQCAMLFQSVQQADASMTRVYGGTGLGLFISKGLAELMGGTVGVESILGKGSIFWLNLNLGIGGGQPRTLVPSLDLRGCRILVVDDNDHARSVIRHMLQSMLFNVTDVASGSAALAELQRAERLGWPFQLVLLDAQMPEMDGITTARHIRQMNGDATPAIIIMGSPEVCYQAEDRENELIGQILIKPVTPSLLFDAAIRALNNVRQQRYGEESFGQQSESFMDSLNGARVLLVEDNEINREVAHEMLQGAGMIVDTAENGQVAIAMAATSLYDVVLMDMQMPVMDGVTATMELRKNPRMAFVPIIALTANVIQQHRDQCYQAGMNDFIAKPINPAQLWATLRAWVKPRTPASIPVPTNIPTATQQSPEHQNQLPATIAGIDLQLGLQMVMGDRTFYLNILRKFLNNHRNAAWEIRQALAENNWDTAERVAHTIKGVAGNIGASTLRSCAIALEKTLRERPGPEELDPVLQRFENVLDTLVTELLRALPQEVRPEPAAITDPSALALHRNTLMNLLADDDATAVDYFEERLDLFHGALPNQFTALQAAITAFDFETALELLQESDDQTLNE